MYPKYSSTSNITFKKYIAHIVEIHSCRMFLSLRGARCTYTHFLMTYVCKGLPSEPPVAHCRAELWLINSLHFAIFKSTSCSKHALL